MLLPVFVFHTTDGLQNGEAVLLSSNMLFKKNESWFFCITKNTSPTANLGVCCTTCLVWCGHPGMCLWLTNTSKSPKLFFYVDSHVNVGKMLIKVVRGCYTWCLIFNLNGDVLACYKKKLFK